MTGSSHCRTYPGSGLVLRIFEAEFFLVPSQLRALPDCQSISALTDTETYFSDKRLLLIACMIRLPTAIENIRLVPWGGGRHCCEFPTPNCIITFLAIVSNVAPPAGKTYVTSFTRRGLVCSVRDNSKRSSFEDTGQRNLCPLTSQPDSRCLASDSIIPGLKP